MLPADPLLQLSGVSKRFESPGGGSPLTILDQVSLDLGQGQSLAITGPSGSGKSTLLHIIGTLDRPTSGEVLLNGQNLGALDNTQLALVRNRDLGFVFQAHYLLPQCTVLENALLPTLAREGLKADGESAEGRRREDTPRCRDESAESRAVRLLKRVGLGERLDHRPGELSGGERQRVAVVRALINRPQLLLADEPTGSLDHASAETLGQLLVELNREEGVALVVVTHSSDLARRMARVLGLKDGHLNPV